MTLAPAFDPARLELDVHTARIITAIAAGESLTATARALGYSQPAISQHLKRLEGRLGLPLTTRSGRGVRLTEAGRVLARHATTVTDALDQAASELAELAGLRSRRVRLAAFPSASSTIVSSLLGAMAATSSDITVTYLEAEPPEAVQSVRTQASDLAITFSYPGDSHDPHRESARGLVVAPLWRDEMLLVLPATHPLAGRQHVELGALAREHWIAGCPRCRGHLLELAAVSGFVPTISYETDNFVAVLNMVAAGVGVALIPQLAVGAARIPSGVVVRPTANRDSRTINLVAQAGADAAPAVAATAAALTALDESAWSLRAAATV